MDEGDDLLHVVACEAAGGEGGRAQPDTARVHRRLVARHRVLNHTANAAAGASIVLRIRIRDPGSCAFLTPGSGIRNRSNFFHQHQQWNNLQFCETYGYKKRHENNFFNLSLLLLFLDPGSEIRDPGSGMGKNQDPGSGMNIPNPQHCLFFIFLMQNKWFVKCWGSASHWCGSGCGSRLPKWCGSTLDLLAWAKILTVQKKGNSISKLRWNYNQSI